MTVNNSKGVGVAQEVEQVVLSPEGCSFDPRLLLAECRGVPERDALALTAPERPVDSAVSV